MNITKEFNIFIDDYNHNHQDAILMIADFLSKTIKAVVANESISATWKSNNK